ncbi:hypothetical protein [Chitinophaga tropicalis]|uniref:Uncharacterized protein n=1 Tax=Chitinophaga tropicalis TaxID=2683588 RepID=A0A7K1TX49_9BACT|nr:hypothetical protein [Chitinophaga tropicalis]MVT06663.1 hypothetical protein [Chitinophaga tropicalis]
MRHLFLPMCLLLLLFAGCKKDEETEPLREFFSFTMRDIIVVGEKPSAILTPANLTDAETSNDHLRLTIKGTADGNESVTFVLKSDLKSLREGRFPAGQGNSMTILYPESGLTLQANDHYGSFSMEIISLQDSLLEARFDAQLIDASGIASPNFAANGFLRAIIRAGN